MRERLQLRKAYLCKAASASNVHPNQELELIDIKGKL